MSGRALTLINLAALALCLGSAVFFASAGRQAGAATVSATEDVSARFVTDATGAEVPVRAYRRIVGGSLVADHLLVQLAERSRIAAIGGLSVDSSLAPHQLVDLPVFHRLQDIEALIELRPDLIVVNNFIKQGAVQQLRAAGLEVFDLGEMQGLDSFLEDAQALADVLGVPERGERFVASFRQKMRSVAADIPLEARPRAIYLGLHSSLFFGGTKGTSYHDVLVHAGLVDAAAERYVAWPALTSEQILELDPEVLVTSVGKKDAVCGRPGLALLRPCRQPGRIVEVPEQMLIDPGAPMLDAAMIVRRAVHGPPPSPPEPRSPR